MPIDIKRIAKARVDSLRKVETMLKTSLQEVQTDLRLSEQELREL